ncbi:MAG: hypothetical protein KC983_11920, partial [Phycisphaerales bacterium]|nr:hypothetical protein [Phycisphaerales bacterium]
GTTEPGSSGSPLYNQDHQIIGQLHGGFAACGNDDSDWYGKFSVSWTGGGSSSTRLRDWLDPDSTGTLVLNTLGTGLQVEPGGAVVHQGLIGGPFSNDPYVYTLTNPLPDPIDYSVSLGAGTAPLTLNGGAGPVSGTLASEATTMITVGVSGGALAMGSYTRDIVFDDVTSGTSTTNTHTVEVGLVGFSTTPEDALFTGGPVGGPFTGSQVYTLTSTQPSPIMIEVTASDAWISVNGGAGPAVVSLNGLGDSANVTIAYTAVANGLAAGLYNGSVSFTSLSGGSDDTSRDVSLDVGRFTYVASGLPTAIPDNNPAGLESVINVTDTYCVGDVDLELAIDHTFVGDLCVELEHNGVVVGVISRMGADTGVECHDGSPFGCSESNFSIKLDDMGAGGLIEDQCSPDLMSPPSYVPNNALAALNGTFVNGDWTLRVIDRASSDTGSLISWTLKIASAGAVCPPVAQDVAVSIPEIVPANILLDGASQLGNHDYIITSLPTNGQLSDPNGGVINAVPYTLIGMGDVVTYDPSNVFIGSDMFTYEVNDGQPSNTATVSITVGGPQLVYDFNLDSDPGWTRTGQWEFGQPCGNDGDPSAGATGLNVYGYNNSGEYPNSMAEEDLTSTAIDCSNLTQTEVRFQRQLGVEHATYDHARFQVSTDGVSFTTVWENQTGFANTLNELSWGLQTYDISAIADGQPTVYLRWKMGTTDTSVTYHGWNIDDIQIWGVQPLAPTTCPWDCRPYNGDGTFGNG